MEEQKTSLIHIITGLEVGGAEMMLCRFLEHADQSRFHHTVVSLKGEGKLGAQLTKSGIPLISLGLNHPLRAIPGMARLVKILRQQQPDLVQMWLTHASLLGSLACLLAGIRSIVWTIHTGNQDESRVKPSIRWMTKLLAKASHWLPRIIVSCSETAKARHESLGYRSEKIIVIPNGTDPVAYQPYREEAAQLLNELGIPNGEPAIGIVGRWTPEKDHQTFFEAALKIQERLPEVHFLICGPEMEPTDERVAGFLSRSQLPEHFHFLGSRSDMPLLYAGMKLLALTSVSEGFPLVLGEAMACETPCVATRVGDCEQIVGDTGVITEIEDPSAISLAWEKILTLNSADYQKLSEQARRRIIDHFSIQECVTSYERLYRELATAPSRNCEPSPLVPNETPVTHIHRH
tara:strand:+ start:9564 stop:10778 length:1215 start_codon:yes stop_codon:yes gene_type:complete